MRREVAARRSPIYLVPSSPRQVMTDASSLLVSGEGRATHRYPLRLLSRIVCNDRIDWTGEALTRCLERGILIQWLKSTQRPIGTARPLSREPDEVGALIEAALERPDWADRHANWLRHQRMRLVRRCRTGRDFSPALVSEAVYRDRLPDTLHPYARMACASSVSALLHQAGLLEQYPAPDGGTLKLADDLTRLVELELSLGFILPIDDGQVILMAAERWLDQDPARIPRLIGRLRRVASAWLEG